MIRLKIMTIRLQDIDVYADMSSQQTAEQTKKLERQGKVTYCKELLILVNDSAGQEPMK